jgi:hypothetical protein
MQSDIKYHGIYRGVVVATNDPENLGRITLRVPQVFGTEVTNWVYPIVGGPKNNKIPYGSFYDTTTQTLTGANTPKAITLNTTDKSNGVTIGAPTSKIIFKYAGTYNVQFSAQVANNGTGIANFWLRKNNTDVPWTNGEITTSNQNHHVLPAWNYVLTLAANDYLEFVWMSNDAANTLEAQVATTSPISPGVPSMIVTATLVGNFLPSSGDPCWVMFEGGDPNFPLWLGTF